MNKLATIETFLRGEIANKTFPGCTFALLENNTVDFISLGQHTYDKTSPPVSIDTMYDCASLTKIIGPMAVAMMLVGEGKLSLDTKVGEILPEFVSEPQKTEVTIRHLLTYTVECSKPEGTKALLPTLTAEQIAHNAMTYPLKYPPGTTYRYSDITMFILTQLLERVTGQNFYQLVEERVFTPLKMHTATFAPAPEMRLRIPPTEVTPERDLVQGFVHDEFTYYTTQGGISNGAAGLFASISDIAQFLQMTVDSGRYNEQQIFQSDIVQMWTKDLFPSLLPTLTPLGWGDQNNDYISRYHRQIVVKSGFTGCFMVGDLQSRRGFALLSNRTYPKRPIDGSAFNKVKERLMEILFT